MIMFLNGFIIAYLLVIPLLLFISETEDQENNPYAAEKFAILWPITSVEIIFKTLRGDFKDDGDD
tara:strand:+ start:460 stop:654 length:195 start_codon:yes stop_codon:yes gene_type:complete